MNKIKLKENEKDKLEEDFGFIFNEETMEVIQANESIDILACAGSGKTTALLAKLKLLVDRMPFENNKGICVLTHTNVAIDEIKERLGEKAEILFKYPNYFGTIDSFVNEYLAIPFYKTVFKKNITHIDDDFFKMKYNYKINDRSGPYLESVHNMIKMEFIKHPELNGFDTLDKVQKRLAINKELQNLRKNEKKILEVTVKNITSLNIFTYQELNLVIKKLFMGVFSSGILRYRDSYSLASSYLSKYKFFEELFIFRYKYVFIDEMQDTKEYQWDILSKIFPDNKVIIQKFGDINQAILSEDKEKCGWDFNETKCLKLLNSKRFNENIAGITCSLRVEGKNCINQLCDFNSCTDKSKISGVDRKNKISFHILIFNDKNKQKVLEKYCEIIKKNKLSDEEKPFKAVCSVGKQNKNLSMPDYFKGFIKQTEHKKEKEKNILLFLENNKKEKVMPNDIYEITLAHLRDVLYENEIKNSLDNYYSKGTLKKHLEQEFNDEYNKLRKSIINYIINYRKDYSESIDKFKEELSEIFLSIFGKELSFINSESKKSLIDSVTNEYSDGDITIKLDTVHGVKGETHTSTLFLDSSFHSKTDFQHIKNVMLKNNEIKGVRMERAIKLAYVAMTRPKHLLCIAVHQDDLNEDDKSKFIENDYEIVNI